MKLPVSPKTVKDLVMLIPNVAILLGKLAMDPRVPTETKAAVGAAAVYVLSPIDGIPDFIPVLGQLDDVLMILLIVDLLFASIDAEILAEHWRGDPALLERVRKIADRVSRFVPSFFKQRAMGRAFGTKLGTVARGAAAFMGSKQGAEQQHAEQAGR